MKKFDKELFKDIVILYVEDDEMTIEEISYFLKRHVKELHVAKDGYEGLELFKKHNPDMVITDIQMPNMDGLQMSEKILEINPSVPIALTTAYSDSKYLIKAIELGIDKYIIKPINMQEILTIIQKSLFLTNDKTIKSEYKDYLEFILDNSSTFMFVVHDNEIEYANQKLLDVLGMEDLNTLNSSKDLVEFENIKTNKNWLDYISSHDAEKYLVHLKNQNNDRFYNKKFYLKYRHFKSVNKGVYLFIDTNDEKLDKINDITQVLLTKLDEGVSNNILMTELKEILHISNRG